MIINDNIDKILINNHNRYINNPYSIEGDIYDNNRSKISFIFISALFIMLIFAIFYKCLYQSHSLIHEMNIRTMRNHVSYGLRGVILDRNEQVIATSVKSSSVWINPNKIEGITLKKIKQLANILNISEKELNNKFNQKKINFVFLARNITPTQKLKILALNIRGINLTSDFKRYYPNRELDAQIIGFTNVDGNGLSGIEHKYNNTLTGYNATNKVILNRQGQYIDYLNNIHSSINGQNIVLSIDNHIQFYTYEALKEEINKVHAVNGSAIVLNAKTGEILSIVNFPTFNPNNILVNDLKYINNIAVTNTYEPGSVIKPLIVAKAINDHIVNENTIFNTLPYKVGNKVIHDVHNYHQLTVGQIIEKSSDVGVSKIALKYPSKYLWNYLHALGFGQHTDINFPGEMTGVLHNYQQWKPIDQASISYGYDISVNLLQLAKSYTMFTNNGCILPISIIKQNKTPIECSQEISPNTAYIMRKMLSKVTAKGGTAPLAQVDDYQVAGKTGTSHKFEHNSYQKNKYSASFIGFAPVDEPKIIVAIVINEPHKGYYGGEIAAPVFSKITKNTLEYLDVKHDK